MSIMSSAPEVDDGSTGVVESLLLSASMGVPG